MRPPIWLPTVVVGVDVETKAIRPDAYIISVGAAAFDVATLKRISNYYSNIDPNNEDHNKMFHTDAETLAYWNGEGKPEYAPSEAARIEAFSGTANMKNVLWDLTKYLDSLGDIKMTITMRGPEFDGPILLNAMAGLNVKQGKMRRFSSYDSDRTAERLAEAFGFTLNPEAEAKNWLQHDQDIEHHAGSDAAREGYTTARIYHLGQVLTAYGYDKALECHNRLASGELYISPFNLG